MRTPEHRAHPRAGKKFEADLDMHYLSPGAFTVLPLDPERLPDPPPAPPPYRLPTTTRRHRHQSFAIIGEASSSSPNSRSSSPSGRVSPFKGHGFNPLGSRHASPSISPVPPEDPRALSPSPILKHHGPSTSSKIPKPASTDGKSPPRKSSTGAIFGEKVSHVGFKGLSRQASQSLTSLEERQQMRRRPPPSPRKRLKGNAAAFKQLSPIQGSSPEPSQSLSSPSRIPTKSKSTPPSRLASPSRERIKLPSRSQSRSNVAKSRDPSPLSSPTKIPIKKYQHVQSKINSFNKPLTSKPPFSSDLSEDSDFAAAKRKGLPSRKNSFNRTTSRPNLLPKTFMGNKNNPNNYTSDSSDAVVTDSSRAKTTTVSAKTFGPKVNHTTSNNNNGASSSSVGKAPSTSVGTKTNSGLKQPSGKSIATKPNQAAQSKNDNNKKADVQEPSNKAISNGNNKSSTGDSNTEDSGKRSSTRGSKVDLAAVDSDEAIPSAMDVVASTTNTVIKPLKIETPKLGRAKPVSPMIDGRILSATSVSQAINKMNDTVLNTRTLIKDSGLQSRLTSASISAVKSDANEKKDGVLMDKIDDVATKMARKEEPKMDVKGDPNKKLDDTTAATKPDSTKVGDKAEVVKASVNDKTAKPTQNNVNSHSSIIQQPGSKSTDQLMNNHKAIPNATTVNNHSTSNNNNHSNNHMASIGLGNARAIEREVQNNMNKLLGSMDSSLGGTPVNKLSANDRIREARTVIAADVKPIRITVREKPSDEEVQSGNVGPHFSVANGINERPSLPPSQQQSPPEEPPKEELPPNRCKRFLDSCTKALSCQRCQRSPKVQEEAAVEDGEKPAGCFKCLSKKTKQDVREQVRINIEEDVDEATKKSVWQKLKCCKKNRVGDTQSCFPLGKRKQSWVERRAGSFLESEVQQRTKCCSKEGCKGFFRKIFCCCRKKKEEPPPLSARKASMVSNKKKSLTPTSVAPPEETKPKIDISLVEHTSHMKGAIPVLPVWLAWFCCMMNCVGPGTGTVLSGLFCLCIGKPRFSQKDGPKPRIGAFIIDLLIGCSQFFTVLFCLVGWGWSIWWGVIMVKVAKRHRKLKHLEKLEEIASKPQSFGGHNKRDAERGRT